MSMHVWSYFLARARLTCKIVRPTIEQRPVSASSGHISGTRSPVCACVLWTFAFADEGTMVNHASIFDQRSVALDCMYEQNSKLAIQVR
ncbi:hypothetical protein BC835DRAFT_595192 [Cytidiella melzeri]|nr:hypothetical protein BC835DRAFT_595192 [Cytidiella melzeri]